MEKPYKRINSDEEHLRLDNLSTKCYQNATKLH